MLQDELESEEIDSLQQNAFLNTPSSLPANPNAIYPATPANQPTATEGVDEYGLPLQQTA